MKSITAVISLFFALFVSSGTAFAEGIKEWQMWHQTSASDMMDRIEWFDAYTLWFITPITIFVMALLLYVMIRFNSKRNPNPSKTSHNSVIEAIWTIGPIIILVMIAFPSFDILDRQLAPKEEPSITLKATGYQWYWGFEYMDGGELSFDTVMLQEDEREETGKTDKSEYPRLLAVDNEVVVPVNEMVRVLVTAADVLHAFALPAFGVKIDAVPGRLNETWFKATREGLFYGQCSELCGRDHAFMPLAIRVVSRKKYDAWKTAAVDDLESANKSLMASVKSKNPLVLAGN